ncbi:MAG: acyl-CoA dehydrogenase family protein [Ottowia sp.]|uniref:acyl-CoA dehydrogenase family protein n=1 Tax=Ottowia sp. TaxID=1898956 RepID=UPI003C74FED7
MDLELNDTQRLLTDSIERLLRARSSFTDRQRILGGPTGWDEGLWQSMAGLGITALPLDASLGPVGEAGPDVMLVMQCLGRALSTEPYLSSCVMAGTAIRLAASTARRDELLVRLADGDMLATLVMDDTNRCADTYHSVAAARHAAGGWTLRGRERHVLHAASADLLVVSARIAESASQPGVFLVPRTTAGVIVTPMRRVDGMPVGSVTFDGVQLEDDACLAQGGSAAAALDTAIDHAVAATVADAAGAMEGALALCIEHARTRRQFGCAIGEFQVMRHRIADMRIALEQTRSMALYAACCLDLSDARHRAAGLSAAKLVLDESARIVAQGAIQLHGGIGMTEEHAIGHYARRLIAARGSFGDFDRHAHRLSALGGLARFEHRQPALLEEGR